EENEVDRVRGEVDAEDHQYGISVVSSGSYGSAPDPSQVGQRRRSPVSRSVTRPWPSHVVQGCNSTRASCSVTRWPLSRLASSRGRNTSIGTNRRRWVSRLGVGRDSRRAHKRREVRLPPSGQTAQAHA